MTMNAPTRILIVDDEEAIRFSLEALLAGDGRQVVAVESGEGALASLANQQFDLVLLDLRLQDMSGLEVLAALREQALDTAVIVLTAHGSMDTAINALRQGAHDYLLKPCDAASLRESVRTALLRREREQRQRALLLQVEQSLTASLAEIRTAVVNPPRAPELETAETTREGTLRTQQEGLVIDSAQHLITLNGTRLELSPTEFDLLAYLAKKAPNVVSPQDLVLQVLGYKCDRPEAGDIVRHHVHRIRQKAKGCAGRTDLIRTVRGVGYALNRKEGNGSGGQGYGKAVVAPERIASSRANGARSSQ
jgi:DNA-binding response OmpR family regulator